MTSPPEPEDAREDYPIGFDETPPLSRSAESSTRNFEQSAALTPYKKGWAMWNKYRDRIRYIWNPKYALWLPNNSFRMTLAEERSKRESVHIVRGDNFVCAVRRPWTWRQRSQVM